MNLFLQRDDCGASCSLGKLYVDGVYFCETLEDVDRKLEAGGGKIHGRTAIPRGTYPIVLDLSQRFGKIMPRLLDVPEFVGVRIHAGNTDADTDGCILVGMVRGDERVIASRQAWQRLMLLLGDAAGRGETMQIEVA